MALKFNNSLSLVSWLHDVTGLLIDSLADEQGELLIRDAGFNLGHTMIAAVGNMCGDMEQTTQAAEQLMRGMQESIENYRATYGVAPETLEKVPEGVTLQ